MSAHYETLQIEDPRPHLRVVRMNRPQAMNAMNTRMGEELRDLFRDHAADALADDLRCVVFIGAGERAFCAGADLKERQGMSEPIWRAQHVIFEEAAEALWRYPVPVIAAVNGVALGGGCELALCADFILAAETARLGQPEVMRGIIPGAGGTQRLPRRIGIARAKELLYTGRMLSAQEALEWGLVNHVVAPEALLDKALALGEQIAANGPIAVRQVKKAVDRGLNGSLADGLVLELEAYNSTIPTEDRHEGVNAFNEKRPPQFKNK